MATTGVRITLRNVRDGGYFLIKEEHAGYENSDWRESHREVIGWNQPDLAIARATVWLSATIEDGLGPRRQAEETSSRESGAGYYTGGNEEPCHGCGAGARQHACPEIKG